MATSFHHIAYQALDICNGVGLDEVLRAVADLPLSDGSRVIDIGAGNGSVAMAVAAQNQVQVDAIEADPVMVDLARARAQDRGLGHQVRFIQALSGEVLDSLLPADLIIALGATDPAGLGRAPPHETMARLAQGLRPGGHLLWGDLTYDGEPPDPIRTYVEITNLYTDDAGWRSAAEAAGLLVLSGQRSAQDVWDGYVGTMMGAVDAWLADHGDDPDAAQVQTTANRLKAMFEYGRPWLGFNLYLMQRPAS